MGETSAINEFLLNAGPGTLAIIWVFAGYFIKKISGCRTQKAIGAGMLGWFITVVLSGSGALGG